MKITKSYAMKAGVLEENYLRGTANVMGRVDRTGDVVFPGFFAPALPAFLKSGFMPLSHEWGELPIAMPTHAEERGAKLDCGFEFHSTQKAQDARIVAKERMARGLDVGLSVGFAVDEGGSAFFSNGTKLLEHAKALGCNMALFDTKQIGSYSGGVRALLPGGCAELYEVSIVTVPASPGSQATSVKSEEREQAHTGRFQETSDRLDAMLLRQRIEDDPTFAEKMIRQMRREQEFYKRMRDIEFGLNCLRFEELRKWGEAQKAKRYAAR